MKERAAAGVSLLSMITLVACGGSSTTTMIEPTTSTPTATASAPTTTTLTTTTTTTTTTPAPSPAPSPAPFTTAGNWGQNIMVNSATSCSLAQNVVNGYAQDVRQSGLGSYVVYAYSPATG